VLEFLVECFGEYKDKGIGRPKTVRARKGKTRGGPDWAQYKRIERLAKQCQQSKPVSREIENALIDAVAALFDTSLKEEPVSRKVRQMSLPERVQFALSPRGDSPAGEPRFTLALVFWIVYFIEHHEWLRPQLEAAHAPDDALWEWTKHATQLYTNTFADSVSSNPWLLAGLPCDLAWNLPTRQSKGTVKWPMFHAVEWLESLLDGKSREALPLTLYPNPEKSHSAKYFVQLKRGTHLPSLANIKRWSEHRWRYKDASASVSPEKLKTVLLWCRALQYALKRVEKRFGRGSIWRLVKWHNRAVAASVRPYIQSGPL